jgi:CheY-like chemotaxis protein
MRSMSYNILVADDDEEDRLLVKEALEECQLNLKINFVQNGVELLDYLNNRNAFQDKEKYSAPCLVLLDLNMPKMDGWEALVEIKADDLLRVLPIVAFTTSKAEADILKTYRLGISSYITKPGTYGELLNSMQALCKYYLDVAKIPSN